MSWWPIQKNVPKETSDKSIFKLIWDKFVDVMRFKTNKYKIDTKSLEKTTDKKENKDSGVKEEDVPEDIRVPERYRKRHGDGDGESILNIVKRWLTGNKMDKDENIETAENIEKDETTSVILNKDAGGDEDDSAGSPWFGDPSGNADDGDADGDYKDPAGVEDAGENETNELAFDNLNDDSQKEIINLLQQIRIPPVTDELDLTSLDSLGSLYDTIKSNISIHKRGNCGCGHSERRFNSGCGCQNRCNCGSGCGCQNKCNCGSGCGCQNKCNCGSSNKCGSGCNCKCGCKCCSSNKCGSGCNCECGCKCCSSNKCGSGCNCECGCKCCSSNKCGSGCNCECGCKCCSDSDLGSILFQ